MLAVSFNWAVAVCEDVTVCILKEEVKIGQVMMTIFSLDFSREVDQASASLELDGDDFSKAEVVLRFGEGSIGKIVFPFTGLDEFPD